MKNTILSLKISLSIFSLLFILTTPSAYADDLEVYGVSESEKMPVNVLFVFDVSGSMAWGRDGGSNPGTGNSRYEIMLEALKNVLESNKNSKNLKVGVSWFSSRASGIRWPITDILADAHDIDNDIPVGAFKSYEIIPHLLETDAQPRNTTGIVQALLEATQYFRGEELWAGANQPDKWSVSENEYIDNRNRLWPAIEESYVHSTTDSSDFWDGAKYKSPITDSCTPNFIVLLSDGKPTSSSTNVRNRIEELSGTSCVDVTGLPDAKCGSELVNFLANNDQIEGQAGTQVKTYTIGFNIQGDGKKFLESLAENGQGEFYFASDASDLEYAFNHIIKSITAENESFSSLVTTIRASTLSSDNRVFMNMFKPSEKRTWIGNTKGYFIDSTGLLDVDGKQAVYIDENNLDKFTKFSKSFWSNEADGNFVELGGASGELAYNSSRKIYTYTGSDAPKKSALTKINVNQSAITTEMMDVSDEAEKRELIDWLLNDAAMGDPLHAKPIMVTYADARGNNKKDVLFSMTNQGLLHAFDATSPVEFEEYDGGRELFAFIPQALLPKLKDHKANLISSDHLYGLDGSISFYHQDTNNDTMVNPGETIILYFGMRRGGRNYYALNVTKLNSPTLEWRIEGGTGKYKKLGQTWSRMTPTTINWKNGNEKKVVIFGGGYDEKADNHITKTKDKVGNAIFIADALTGERLLIVKKGTKKVDADKNMIYSIPGDIRVIDSNFDGIADRLYFADIGGQVWRVDLVKNKDTKNNKSITGYRLASVTPKGSASENRRFYSIPEIAKMKDDLGFYYAIALGSGFRAHPNSLAVNDRVYMIKDNNVDIGKPATTPPPINEGGLLNITNNINKANISDLLKSRDGWRLELKNAGEKSLTPMLIFNSQLVFTTFTPVNEDAMVTECAGGGGVGRYYQINLEDGTPVKDFYDDSTPPGNLTASNRSKTLPGQGIPTEVIRRFLAPDLGGGTQESVGKGIVGNSSEIVHKINWKQME